MKNYDTLTCDRLKKMLERYKIKWIDNYTELKNLIYLKTTLPITFCSKNKSNRDNVTPREFYISARNLRFYDFCDKFNLNYGILSASPPAFSPTLRFAPAI